MDMRKFASPYWPVVCLVVAVACSNTPHPVSEVGTVSFPNSGAPEAQEPFQRGIALLHNFEYRSAIEAFQILYGKGDKRERDRAYAKAMAELHENYPGDVEVTVFYALSLLGTAHEGRDFATYMRSAALLEEVYPDNPWHPGVLHYLIHCYDDPIHAPLGLRAARTYAKVAPAAAHAQHMTSHIFVAMGMWNDVVKAK